MPPATGLEGSNETVDELLGSSTNVGHDFLSGSMGAWEELGGAVSFAWQSSFDNRIPPFLIPPLLLQPRGITPLKTQTSGIRNTSQVDVSSLAKSLTDTNFFLSLQNTHRNSDSDSNSSDDDGSDALNRFGNSRGHKRRLSSTTEAKRRTSLEDDDDDEVVHVKMDVGDVSGGARTESPEGIVDRAKGAEDDGELIEIGHGEVKKA